MLIRRIVCVCVQAYQLPSPSHSDVLAEAIADLAIIHRKRGYGKVTAEVELAQLHRRDALSLQPPLLSVAASPPESQTTFTICVPARVPAPVGVSTKQ